MMLDLFPPTRRILTRWARQLALAALVLGLAACNNATPSATNTPTQAVDQTPVTSVPSPEPTTTSAKVILVSDTNAAPAEVQNAETRLTALAAQANLTLVKAETLIAADLTADVKIVVWLGSADGIADLASGAPQVQFVAITPAEIQPSANLSVIHDSPANVIFIAGYISTLIAPDWRGAALLPSDGPLGDQVQSVFENGGRFFCGRCAPAYAPVVLFPLSATLPASSPASAWQAAYDTLNQNVIEVLYVSDPASSPELLAALKDAGVTLIGSQTPSADLQANWAVTVQMDSVSLLDTLWPDLLAGNPGQALEAPVTLSDINPDKFSPGRQELVETMIANLQNGLVDPFSVPAQ